MRFVSLFMLVIATAVGTARLHAAADPAVAVQAQVADKTRAVANIDLSIKSTEARQITLKKSQERLKTRITALEAAAADLAKLKTERDAAEAHVIATTRQVDYGNGRVEIIQDAAAVKAQGIAQKAYNAAKRDNAGADDQLAQLKAQADDLNKQEDTLAKRLETQTADREKAVAALEEAKAALAAAKAGNAAPAAPAQ